MAPDDQMNTSEPPNPNAPGKAAPLHSRVDASNTTNENPLPVAGSSNGIAAMAGRGSVDRWGSAEGDLARRARGDGAFRTSLLGSALIALSVGAMVMIAFSRLRDEAPLVDHPWANEFAVVAGLLATGITVWLYSRLSRGSAAPDRVNPWQFGELCARRDYLEASYAAYCTDLNERGSNAAVKESRAACEARAACNEAAVHIHRIGEELGLITLQRSSSASQPNAGYSTGHGKESPDKWILGTGFVELWQRLHAADAALYGQRPLPLQLSYASHDSMRLSGCAMANGGALKERLDLAITTLDKIYRRGVTEADGVEIDLATQTLIGIRKKVDSDRDQSRAGLARTRVHLIWAGLMTAAVTYTLLALAILDDVPSYQIVAGAAFFLVGAVAGLIWQLRHSGSTVRSGEDDFGLDAARLVYGPVLSGLAGVGGVLVVAMLYPALNVVPDTSGAGDVRRAIPAIGNIFNLNANRFGLLVAAVFGLTPDLLINRLQGQADRFRTQLEASSIHTRSNEPFVVTNSLVAQVVAAIDAKRDGTITVGGVSGASEASAVTAPTGATGPAEKLVDFEG
jgi:hypothetical protein